MFKDKNNPLLDVAKAAMQKGDERRKAESAVNEHFGVYSRRALPLAQKADYDIALKKVLAGDKLVLEDVEQLDELSKKTLGSYIKKASSHKALLAADISDLSNGDGIEDHKTIQKAFNKEQKRTKGISKAVDKLVKEEPEQLEEGEHMTRLRKFERNEDNNYHRENRILLAKHYGTPEEHADAVELGKQHLKQGSLPVGTPLYDKVYKANNGHYGKLQAAAKAEWDAMPKGKKKNKPLSLDEEHLQELSKYKLSNYIFNAGDDVQKRARKWEAPDDAKIDNRLNNMDKAVGKVKEKEKKENSLRAAIKAKVASLNEVSKNTLTSYVSKAVAKQQGLVNKRKAVEAQPELEKKIRKVGAGINNAKDKIEGNRGSNRSWQKDTSGKLKPTKVFASLKEAIATVVEGYSKTAVDKEIKKDKRIKGKEAKMIHAVLKGRQKEDEPIKEEHEKGKEIVQNKDTYRRLLKSGKMLPPAKKLEKREKVVAEDDLVSIKEEIANSLYKRYEAVNEDEKQAWVDALNEEEFGILYEFYNPNIKIHQSHGNPLADARAAIGRGIGRMGDVIDRVNTPPGVDDYQAGVSAVARGTRAIAGDLAGVNPVNNPANRSSPKAISPAPMAPRPPATAPVQSAQDDAMPTPKATVQPAVAAGGAAATAKPPVAPMAPKTAKDISLQQVWAGYTPEEKSKREGMVGRPAIDFDTEVAKRLASASNNSAEAPTPAAAPAAAPKADPTPAPAAPAAPETSDDDAPASTAAAAAETRSYKRPAPMAPKRSFGFGSGGSGSDSAGAITNRSLGAVNEEVSVDKNPRGSLNSWLNKYVPKKKK